MPVFQYKALTAKGDNTTGVVDANTPKEAREKLRGRNIFVTEMNTVGDKKKEEKLQTGQVEYSAGNALEAAKSFKLPSFRAVAARGEVPGLTRLMATLLHAGIPLVDALGSLISQ